MKGTSDRVNGSLRGSLTAFIVGGLCAVGLPRIREAVDSSPKTQAVKFKNIALSSGVRFVLNNSATPHKYQIEPMVAGVAVFDHDNDGLPTFILRMVRASRRCRRPARSTGIASTAVTAMGRSLTSRSERE